MRWLLVCSVALAVLPGCTGSGGSRLFDPFSQTTIEPPRTGWITGQPASDPYYPGSRQAGLSIPPPPDSGWTAHATASSEAPRFQPGSEDNAGPAPGQTRALASAAPGEPGDSIAIPVAAREGPPRSSSLADRGKAESSPASVGHDARAFPGTTGATSSAVASAESRGSASVGGDLGAGDRVMGTIRPGARQSAPPPYGGFPRRTMTRAEPQPGRLDGSPTIDIMDLPPAESSRSSLSRGNSGKVRFASAIEEVTESATPSVQESGSRVAKRRVSDLVSSSSRTRYAHDPQYRWLRGRLEYSETARRWKLRYIPVEGRTDEYGGSIVVANPSRLSGYERGQFVEIEGRLGPAPQGDAEGYAPEFEISEIRSLGN